MERKKILEDLNELLEEWAEKTKEMSKFCLTRKKEIKRNSNIFSQYLLVPGDANVYERIKDFSSFNDYLVKAGLSDYVKNICLSLEELSTEELLEILEELKKATEEYYKEFNI